jgi:hypothetical protein
VCPSAADSASYAAFGLTLTAWNTYGVRLVAAREAGVLKRWRATLFPRWCYFVGRIAASVVAAVVARAATVTAGVLSYRTHLTISDALGALVAFVLGAFAWAATALTAVIPTVEAAAPTFMLTYFPVIVISGIFGSISEPHWLSTIASYLPAQPLVHATATALGHTAGHPLLPRARPHRARRLGGHRARRRCRHLPVGAAPADPTTRSPGPRAQRVPPVRAPSQRTPAAKAAARQRPPRPLLLWSITPVLG